jgi:hypothetical protein
MHPTCQRLWKSLTPDERLSAATHFWKEPSGEVVGTALGALVKARHLRPQAARALPQDAQARILATVLEPGEGLAAALLVALHLGERRPLLSAFLDALGLPHENGVLKDEADAQEPGEEKRMGEEKKMGEEKMRAAVKALDGFPTHEVATYLNTLWLQDPQRWGVLEKVAEAV